MLGDTKQSTTTEREKVFYMLKLYTRIKSFATHANVEKNQLLNYAKDERIKIEPKEIKLAKVCSLFFFFFFVCQCV